MIMKEKHEDTNPNKSFDHFTKTTKNTGEEDMNVLVSALISTGWKDLYMRLLRQHKGCRRCGRINRRGRLSASGGFPRRQPSARSRRARFARAGRWRRCRTAAA